MPTTREQELRLIDELLKFADDKQARDAFDKAMSPLLPKDFDLRLRGAALEASAELHKLHRPIDRKGAMTDTRSQMIVMAAVMRCAGNHPCPHMRTASIGDITLFAFASARVISCRECLPRFMHLMQAADAERRDECDLCLALGQTHFADFRVALPTGVVVIGSACDKCHRQHIDKNFANG